MVIDKSKVFSESYASIDYQKEYKQLKEENINLKEENKTLKETVVKLAVKL